MLKALAINKDKVVLVIDHHEFVLTAKQAEYLSSELHEQAEQAGLVNQRTLTIAYRNATGCHPKVALDKVRYMISLRGHPELAKEYLEKELGKELVI